MTPPDAVPDPPQIELSSLQLGPELGSGAQGVVYETKSDPARVAKIYPPGTAAHLHGFAHLFHTLATMPIADASLVRSHTAWPETVIVDRGSCRGFVMPRIPDRLLSPTSSRSMHLLLQHALHPEKATRLGIRLPDNRGRLHLVAAYLPVVAALHRATVALGDISQRNLIWALGRGGRVDVFAIDIDSAAVVGAPRALPAVQTPDWVDTGTSAGSIEGDRLKIALLAFRTCHADPKAWPGPTDPRLDATRPGWTPGLGDLVRRGLHDRPASRPTAEEWCTALQRALAGVAATVPGAARSQNPPLARPSIPLLGSVARVPARSSTTTRPMRPVLVTVPRGQLATRTRVPVPRPTTPRTSPALQRPTWWWRGRLAPLAGPASAVAALVIAAAFVIWR